MCTHARPLRDRVEDRALVELLQRSLTCLDEWTSAADHHERRLCGEGVGDCGDDTSHAGACGDDGHATGAVDPSPCLCSMGRRLLMPHVDHAHPLEPAALVD